LAVPAIKNQTGEGPAKKTQDGADPPKDQAGRDRRKIKIQGWKRFDR
jgi:hypothetical protein